MKVELSPTSANSEQMMGIMQQLLQAKSADGGQQEGESSGTGRGDANDDSDGAGRPPREEGTTGARIGATTATAAGGRVFNHIGKVPNGSRPADDTGRRPEFPADLGAMISMQCGETGD